MNQNQTATSISKKFIGVAASLLTMIALIFLYLVSPLFIGDYVSNVYLADLLVFGFFIILAAIINYFVFKSTWGNDKAKKFTIVFLSILIAIWLVLAVGSR